MKARRSMKTKLTFIRIAVAMLALAALGGVFAQTPEAAYKIGDIGPGGGVIFYVSETGFTVEGHSGGFESYIAHYLEAAPAGTSTIGQWGDPGTLIAGGITTFESNAHADAAKIGNGRRDTAIIVEHMAGKSITGTAAQICAALNVGGKDDWFLPSLGELALLYAHRRLEGIDITPGAPSYWSSTQRSNVQAWYVGFSSSATRAGNQKGYGMNNVRAIRAF
jgi:hypothetical protein